MDADPKRRKNPILIWCTNMVCERASCAGHVYCCFGEAY